MSDEITGQPSGGTPGTPAPAVPGTVVPPAAPAVAAPPVAPAAPAVPGVPAAEKPWWDGIQEPPVRELMEKKNYANPQELAMAYYNANKLVSGAADAAIIPAADAPQEQWDAFYTKMGRPESPDKYEFTHKDGVVIDPRMETFGKNLFHKLGLNPAQAQKGVSEWNDFMGEYHQALMADATVKNDNELNELRTRWGNELDANLAAGREAMKTLNIPVDLVARVEENAGSAAVLEMLAAIGKASPEGKFTSGGGGDDSNPANMSKERAATEIAKLRADAAFSKQLEDKNDPMHKDAVDKLAALYARV